jgi:hypothetical protein
MLRTAALLVGLAALIPLSAAGADLGATGLRGTVVLSPSQPVCYEDEPCSKPASGYVMSFSRNGRVVGRATTRVDGRYRVLLAVGRYAVSFTPRRPTLTLKPTSVLVVAGRIRRVDFEIDTGLR